MERFKKNLIVNNSTSSFKNAILGSAITIIFGITGFAWLLSINVMVAKVLDMLEPAIRKCKFTQIEKLALLLDIISTIIEISMVVLMLLVDRRFVLLSIAHLPINRISIYLYRSMHNKYFYILCPSKEDKEELDLRMKSFTSKSGFIGSLLNGGVMMLEARGYELIFLCEGLLVMYAITSLIDIIISIDYYIIVKEKFNFIVPIK